MFTLEHCSLAQYTARLNVIVVLKRVNMALGDKIDFLDQEYMGS